MIFCSRQVQQSELYLVVITCIQLVFRSLLLTVLIFQYAFLFLVSVCIIILWRNFGEWLYNLTSCNVLGIYLQSLHLSDLQQIHGRYGGKRTFLQPSFLQLRKGSFFYFHVFPYKIVMRDSKNLENVGSYIWIEAFARVYLDLIGCANLWIRSTF